MHVLFAQNKIYKKWNSGRFFSFIIHKNRAVTIKSSRNERSVRWGICYSSKHQLLNLPKEGGGTTAIQTNNNTYTHTQTHTHTRTHTHTHCWFIQQQQCKQTVNKGLIHFLNSTRARWPRSGPITTTTTTTTTATAANTIHMQMHVMFKELASTSINLTNDERE